MSVLTQFAGGGVKSVQRGLLVISRNNYTASVTIAEVDPSKTMVNLLAITERGTWIVLSNSTTVTAETLYPSNVAFTLSYEVIEFY